VILMAFDDVGRNTLMRLPATLLALVIGWSRVREQIDTSALEKPVG
jgi:L-asparagine permease